MAWLGVVSRSRVEYLNEMKPQETMKEQNRTNINKCGHPLPELPAAREISSVS